MDTVNVQQPMLSTDHDILIRLVEKVDALKDDIKDIRDGTSKRLEVVEAKVESHDKMLQTYDPTVLVPQFQVVAQQFHDFTVRYKLILTILGILSPIVGGLIVFLLQVWIGRLFS